MVKRNLLKLVCDISCTCNRATPWCNSLLFNRRACRGWCRSCRNNRVSSYRSAEMRQKAQGRKSRRREAIVESACVAKTHLEYQEIWNSKDNNFSLLFRDTGISIKQPARDMKVALLALGVDIHLSTCIEHIKTVASSNCLGISPIRSGGVFIPSKIEKDVAKPVKTLRDRKFPVFTEDVI